MTFSAPVETWPTKVTILLLSVGVAILVYSLIADPSELVRLRFDGNPANDGTIDPIRNVSAYASALFVLAVGALCIAFGPPITGKFHSLISRPRPWIGTVALGVFVALIILALTYQIQHLPLETFVAYFAQWYSITALPSLGFFLAGAFASAGALTLIAFKPAYFENPVWFLVGYVAILSATLPGFGQTVSLENISIETLQAIEAHFTGVLGPSESAISGTDNPYVGYSYLGNLLAATVQSLFGTWSFSDYVRAIQASNTAFLLASFFACFLLARRQPLVALGTLFLILPWAHNAHQNLFFPNQSGFRFLAIPIAMVALALAARFEDRKASYFLGATAGISLAWNLETGVAITTALAAFVLLRVPQPLSFSSAKLLLRFFLSIVCVAIAVAMLEYGFFRDFSLTSAFYGSFSQKAAIREGYGLSLYWDPIALVLAGTAGWVLLDTALRRRNGQVPIREAIRGSLAILVLVWGVYYIARPHPWNLWSYLLPAGFLFVDQVIRVLSSKLEWNWRPIVVYGSLAITILGPAAFAWNYQLAHGLWRASFISTEIPSNAVEVSGVRVAAEIGPNIIGRAEAVQAAEANALVLTGNSILIPKLAGRYDIFLPENIVFSFFGQHSFQSLVGRINEDRPSMIFVDATGTVSENGNANLIMREVEKSLATNYSRLEDKAGWAVWVSQKEREL